MKPEQAVAAARSSLERERADGSYSEDLEGWRVQPPERPSTDSLLEWAIIEPDMDLVVSTRRWGAPISAVKRVLVHLTRQYTAQLASQQTRVNVHLMGRLGELDERLADVNHRLGDLENAELGRRIAELEGAELGRRIADLEDADIGRGIGDVESPGRE
ncbi:MAG TPA: hypothetical protein VIJ51_12350 [Solirubrobacteraceae bacterium]